MPRLPRFGQAQEGDQYAGSRVREETAGKIPTPATMRINPFGRAKAWVVSALGLQSNQTPTQLLLPNVQPVMEMHRSTSEGKTVPNPAAGAINLDITVPLTEIWEFVSLSFSYIASAVAGNRAIGVQLLGPDSLPFQTYFRAGANVLAAANAIHRYTFAPTGVMGLTLTTTGPVANHLIPAPIGLRLGPAHRIRLEFDGAQAGDQAANVVMAYFTLPA